MNILFLHRNFPAQFVHLAQYFAKDPNNKVVFITGRKEGNIENVIKVVYEPVRQVSTQIHNYLKFTEDSILHGQAAANVAIQLKNQGFVPDIIYGHIWGQTMFMKDVFPNTPLLCYFEWFYNAHDSDVDFVSQGKLDTNTEAKTRVKNSHILVDLYSCDCGITPTKYQLSQFPKEFRHKISVLHDGINTDYIKPSYESKLILPNLDLSESNEIITYVSRGLEPYRGFPQFMEAAKIILERRPNCHIVVVGDDGVYYGAKLPEGQSFREIMLKNLNLDSPRLHFTGRIPYNQYVQVLQASSAHVYLTFPFVLSWSMMEAMAAGCLIIGSDTPPVRELIQDSHNGLLVDFFSPTSIADRVDVALDNRETMMQLRQNARKTIEYNYQLKDLLPKHIDIINNLVNKKR